MGEAVRPAEPDDAGLVRSGFDAYVASRGGDLWWSAWLLTGDRHHAEDLVQTALAKTFSRYDTFDNDHHYESYVRTTMYRTFVSWWRHYLARHALELSHS